MAITLESLSLRSVNVSAGNDDRNRWIDGPYFADKYVALPIGKADINYLAATSPASFSLLMASVADPAVSTLNPIASNCSTATNRINGSSSTKRIFDGNALVPHAHDSVHSLAEYGTAQREAAADLCPDCERASRMVLILEANAE